MTRRGFSMIEVVAACSVLAAMISLAAQGLIARARHERELTRRAVVLENMSSALEEITSLPFDDIVPAAAEQLKLAARFAELPGLTVKLDVADEPEPVPGKRIELTVEWNSSQGPPHAVRLQTFVYRGARVVP